MLQIIGYQNLFYHNFNETWDDFKYFFGKLQWCNNVVMYLTGVSYGRLQCCHSTADFQGLWLVNLIQTSSWLVETDTTLKLMLSTCHHHILELDLTIIKPQQNLLNEAFFSRKIYDCNFLNPPDQAETWLKTSNIHVGLIAWLNGSMILWPFTCHNSWVFTFNIKIHRKSISFSSVFFYFRYANGDGDAHGTESIEPYGDSESESEDDDLDSVSVIADRSRDRFSVEIGILWISY